MGKEEMTQVLLLRPFTRQHLDKFADLDGFEFIWADEPSKEQLAGTKIILGKPTIGQIAAAKNLEWIQLPIAGCDDYLRCPEMFGEGLILTNLSGAFGQSISEFVLVMVLSLYKHMQIYRDNQRAHNWHDEGVQQTPAGKRLLILGAGNIGCMVARLFRPFGCHITGMRRVPREIPEDFDAMITMDGLDDALKEADIVVCALPDTALTHGLMDRKRISLLKKSAILINVGRGSLVDCDALAERLMKGELFGAALDVTSPEPLPASHPLWDCPNAIITPHVSGGSIGHLQETTDALFSICRENLMRWKDGRTLLNIVDFATGYRTTGDRA